MSDIAQVLDAIQSDIDKGRIKEALKALKRAVPRADGSKDEKDKARAHFLLGKALTRDGELVESAKEYLKALDIYSNIPDGNGMAETLLGLGVLHRWRSDFATAEEFLEQFLDQARELNNEDQIGQAHTELGIVLAERSILEGAIAHFNEAIAALKRTKNMYQLSRAYHSLGESLKRKDKFIEAFENFEECIKIAEELGLERNIAYASASAAECLAKSEHYDRADKYVERAIAVFKKTDDQIGLSDAMRVHGLVEWKKGNLKEAEKLFHKALEMIKSRDVPGNEVQLRFDYAEFLMGTGRLEEAAVQADEAIKMARRIGGVAYENRAWSIKNKIKGVTSGPAEMKKKLDRSKK